MHFSSLLSHHREKHKKLITRALNNLGGYLHLKNPPTFEQIPHIGDNAGPAHRRAGDSGEVNNMRLLEQTSCYFFPVQ